MPIADGPVAPLAVGCCLQTLTDTVAALCLCLELVDVGCHDLLADRIVGSGLIDEESTVVDSFHGFVVHATSIGTDQAGTEVMEDTLSGVTRTQAMGSPDVRR